MYLLFLGPKSYDFVPKTKYHQATDMRISPNRKTCDMQKTHKIMVPIYTLAMSVQKEFVRQLFFRSPQVKRIVPISKNLIIRPFNQKVS